MNAYIERLMNMTDSEYEKVYGGEWTSTYDEPQPELTLEAMEEAIESLRQDLYYIESNYIPLTGDDGKEIYAILARQATAEPYLLINPLNTDEVRKMLPMFRLVKIGGRE